MWQVPAITWQNCTGSKRTFMKLKLCIRRLVPAAAVAFACVAAAVPASAVAFASAVTVAAAGFHAAAYG